MTLWPSSNGSEWILGTSNNIADKKYTNSTVSKLIDIW